MTPPRIGVFGGAFDPPHYAHLALAQAAVAQLQLDTLYIVPTGQAWHKARTLTAAQHRMAMTQLAFAGIARTRVDGREIARTGPSYTIDTLRALQAEHPAAQLYLIMGYDQALALTTWHCWQDIVQLAIICVAPRPVAYDKQSQSLENCAHGPAIVHLQMPSMPLSATQIRQKIALQQPIDALVPDAVVRYIDQHHLYQST